MVTHNDEISNAFNSHRLHHVLTGESSRRGSRVDDPTAYHAETILYLKPNDAPGAAEVKSKQDVMKASMSPSCWA